jgi:hypothetical protein
MLYSDEFLESLKADPIAGVKLACHLALNTMKEGGEWTVEEMEALEEADVLFTELTEAGMMPVVYSVEPLLEEAPRGHKVSKIRDAIGSVLKQCEQLELRAQRERLASRIRIGLGRKFAYEFSQGDIERIQSLLNDLRNLVSASDKFKLEHQHRLLARLEALQRELHKKVSDLDRFWGLIGDAGVVLAKLGNDAKPIVDRVREIADIVWNTQGRAEELPSTAKPPQIGYEQPNPDRDVEASQETPSK